MFYQPLQRYYLLLTTLLKTMSDQDTAIDEF